MAFSYANLGSGPYAGGIGWFDFGNFTIAPGETKPLSGTLANGITVDFTVSLAFLGGSPRNFSAVPAPATAFSYFGSPAGGYTGLAGNTVLYSGAGASNNLSSLTFTNIVVKDAQGNIMPNYTVVLADGESTSGDALNQEGLSFITNGGNWVQIAALGANNPPNLIGGGTFVGMIGVSAPPNTAYVFATQSPNTVVANIQEALASTFQGIAIGFAATQIQVYKNVLGRRDPADQFDLIIGGNPTDTATTTGASTGLQAEFASVAAVPGTVYNINEAMAAGSVSAITDYTKTVTAVNLTPGGTNPPLGALPIAFNPQIGDIVQYTITNRANEVFTKTVDKQFATVGDKLTYTVSIFNPNNSAITNVNMIDPLPNGTVYSNNLIVSDPYTGTDPQTGITITNIAAGATATISWQVTVVAQPAANPLANIATVTVPNGFSGNTNPAETIINYADLNSQGNFVKTANPSFADIGDTVTYTLTLTNSGNVDANNVVLTDILPAGTTYVANSVASNVSFSGDPTTSIVLNSPIAPAEVVTVTFDVTIDSIPATNPISNTASVDYEFTVDPQVPNGASGSGTSTEAQVTVNNASLTINKTADKTIAFVGDTIKYTIVIKNEGNVAAENVVITDQIPAGTSYVANSLTSTVAVTGDPNTTINLTNPLAAGATATITFEVLVESKPDPNTIKNVATAAFTYTVDPENPNGASGTAESNAAASKIYKYDFTQQINDIIESVALQEAALANILNAEGAKIQKIVTLPNVTPEQLACLNDSVTAMTEAINMHDSILKSKLNIFDCKINFKDC